MIIDLKKLNYQDKIEISDTINIPEELVKNTEIVSLDNVMVNGTIKYDYEDNIEINLKVNSVMNLHDAIDNEIIGYPFEIIIEEILEKSIKSLDLNEFLWQYIVLEIPLRYTLHEGDTSVEADNYRIISEEEYNKKNNPFSDLFLE